MNKIEQLEKQIEEIQERNIKVGTNKAWEISKFRKIVISILTYCIVVIFFFITKLPNPFVNALVPTVAFLISTLSISVFKKLWVRWIYKR